METYKGSRIRPILNLAPDRGQWSVPRPDHSAPPVIISFITGETNLLQVVSRRAARVLSLMCPCEICGARSDPGAGVFLPLLRLAPLVDWDSLVGIAARYGLDVPGI
jgi:hypothetical protein